MGINITVIYEDVTERQTNGLAADFIQNLDE